MALGELVVVLFFGLREVDEQRRIVFIRQRARGLQSLIGVGVERVRRDGRDNQRIVVEALNEALREA